MQTAGGLVVLAALILPRAAHAQEDARPVPPIANAAPMDAGLSLDADNVSVGIVGVISPEYEGASRYRLFPAPAVIGSRHGYAFSLIGNQLSFDLVRNKPGEKWDLQAGPLVALNINSLPRAWSTDRQATRLEAPGTAIEVGGFVGVGKSGVLTSPYDNLSVAISYRHDVSGTHDGTIIQPSVTYVAPLSTKTIVAIVASVDLVDRAYACAYFGITPEQAQKSGAPTYMLEGGVKNWSIGAVAAYSLSGDILHGLKLVSGVNYSRMTGDIAASPLVRTAGSKDQWLGTMGFAFTF